MLKYKINLCLLSVFVKKYLILTFIILRNWCIRKYLYKFKTIMNLKKLLLATVFSASRVMAADNVIPFMMEEEKSPIKSISSIQRTTQQYLDDFEINYRIRLQEKQKLKGGESLRKNLAPALGLAVLTGGMGGLLFGGAAYVKGSMEGGDDYIRQRPRMFAEMFPDENETRNAALEIITRDTEQYIQDKKDYPIPGSHTVLSMFR